MQWKPPVQYIMLVCYYKYFVFFIMTSALPVYFAPVAIVAVEGLTEPPLIVGLSQVVVSEKPLIILLYCSNKAELLDNSCTTMPIYVSHFVNESNFS